MSERERERERVSERERECVCVCVRVSESRSSACLKVAAQREEIHKLHAEASWMHCH